MRKMWMLVLLVLAVLGVDIAVAATERCTVVAVRNNKMIIECGERAKDFVAGNEIKIKSERTSVPKK